MVELILAGEGTEFNQLKDYADRLSNGAIQVMSTVPRSAVPLLLASAHVGIIPFKNEVIYLGSSPIKLFEYMAAGMPVLLTRIPCHTDVVGNESYVFWAEDGTSEILAAAIRAVCSSKNHLREVGRLAQLAVEAWT